MGKNILKKFCTITSTKDDAVNSFHCTYIYSGTVYYDIALCPPLKAGQFENQRIFKLLRLYIAHLRTIVAKFCTQEKKSQKK